MEDPLSFSAEEEEKEFIETRRKWTHQEIAAFLTVFAERKQEFLNRRKKKCAMSNILNDLLGQGVLIRPTTVDMLTEKLRSLLQNYERGINNAAKTGENPCSIPFEDQLENIFKDEPELTNLFSIDLPNKPETLLVPMINQPEEDEWEVPQKKIRLDEEKCVEDMRCAENRRKWTIKEIEAFLSAYEKRKDEFLHSRKKIFAMENVLNDLVSQDVFTQPTTVYMLTSKIRSLLRAYKRSKTGDCQLPIRFEEQLDGIFEDSPELANSYCPGLFETPETSVVPKDDEELEEGSEKRRRWTHEEIAAFLAAYAERKHEFLHVRKKKLAMKKVLKDLRNRGVLTQTTTVENLNSKMKSLWRAYKEGKVKAFKTGVKGTSIPFEDELEAIFGERITVYDCQSVSNSHMPVISLSSEESLPTSASKEHELYQKSMHKITDKEKYLEEKLKLKSKYLEEKLQLKKESKINKQKRHEEKLSILNKFLNNFHNET